MFLEMRSPEYQLDIAMYENELLRQQILAAGRRRMIKDGPYKPCGGWGTNFSCGRGGVIMTSEAELEVREFDNHHKKEDSGKYPKMVPWINVKFTSVNVKGVKMPASENREYQRFAKLGISAIGECVDMVMQARIVWWCLL